MGFLLACLASCGPQAGAPPEPQQRLRVIASFMPVYAHAARVAGDKAEVSMLLRADAGPHDYQLTPDDVKRLASADVFVINGAGIEEWLEDLVKAAASPKLRVVDSSKGLEFASSPAAIEIPGTAGGHDHGHHHDHDHAHHGHDHGDGANPHIWLDPVYAIHQTRLITEALMQADPANASAYEANSAAYVKELEQLDRDFSTVLRDIPNKNLITFHDAFPYLAKRYGMNSIGYVEAFPEKDPTPAQLKALVNAIRKHRVGVLFAEVGYSPKIFEVLAQQTGAKIAELDTLEVGEADPNAYLVRMRRNLEALQKAWQ